MVEFQNEPMQDYKADAMAIAGAFQAASVSQTLCLVEGSKSKKGNAGRWDCKSVILLISQYSNVVSYFFLNYIKNAGR